MAPYQAHSAALAVSDSLADSPLFDTQYYLSHDPDLAAAGVDPVQYFEQYCWTEGRDPSAAFSTQQCLAAYTDVAAAKMDSLSHYAQLGQAKGRMAFPAPV